MALLNNGHLVFEGPPDALVEQAKNHVWRIQAAEHELEQIKERYPVIATIPAESGWEVEVVAENLDTYPGKPIDPNLEHAYVYFMEYKLGASLDEKELAER
jgi:ABC-type multidrug transport system ATPase subunit